MFIYSLKQDVKLFLKRIFLLLFAMWVMRIYNNLSNKAILKYILKYIK